MNNKSKKDKTISPLKLKFTLFFMVFMTAVFTVIIIVNLQQVLNLTTVLCARQGLPVVEKVIRILDVEAFKRLAKSLDKTDPYYESTRLKMLAIKNESNSLHLYTVVPVTENIYRYVIDGSGNYGGQAFSPLGAEDDTNKFDEAINRALKTGTSQFGKIGYQDKLGWVVSTYMPILDASGKSVGVVGCDLEAENLYVTLRSQIVKQIALAIIFIVIGGVVYVSLYRQINRQNIRIIELKKAFETASEAKSSFLANLSNEIRTPLSTILGMAEFLTRCDISEDVVEEAMNIKQAGSNLLDIVNEILDFSKTELGSLKLVKKEYSLTSVLKDVVTITRGWLSEKNLTFNIHINSSLPANLYGDDMRVKQTLLNLLSNAVKYTGTGAISFMVNGKKENDIVQLVFTIADTGTGVKEEDFQKLFGEFIQFDSHRNHEADGAGLGFAISRNLCRLMGGDITVSSVYGKGSVFIATIFQEVRGSESITPETVLTILSGKYLTGNMEEAGMQFTAPEARVLVVDDIVSNLMVIKGLLSSYSLKVETAKGGMEALKTLALGASKNNFYDIIFINHMMLGMDGIETAAAIRGFGGGYFQKVPIIVLASNVVSGTREMFLEKGFSDCLSKPVDVLKLDEILRKWIPASKIEVIEEELEKNQAGNRGGELNIPGLDVERGVLMTGGDFAGYLLLLAKFCKEAGERLELLQTAPGKADLPVFIKQVYALKGSFASLGALELSVKAAKLESAGRAGDIAVIQETLPDFTRQLTEMIAGIRAALNEDEAETFQSASVDLSMVMPLFEELINALKTRKIKTIDSILEKLNREIDDLKIREALEQISNEALVNEYDKAIGIAEGLINKR